MNPPPQSIPIQRYLAIDIHKHYVMVGGQNRQQEWTLRPRRSPHGPLSRLGRPALPAG